MPDDLIRDLVLVAGFLFLNLYSYGLWERREKVACVVFNVVGVVLFPGIPIWLAWQNVFALRLNSCYDWEMPTFLPDTQPFYAADATERRQNLARVCCVEGRLVR